MRPSLVACRQRYNQEDAPLTQLAFLIDQLPLVVMERIGVVDVSLIDDEDSLFFADEMADRLEGLMDDLGRCVQSARTLSSTAHDTDVFDETVRYFHNWDQTALREEALGLRAIPRDERWVGSAPPGSETKRMLVIASKLKSLERRVSPRVAQARDARDHEIAGIQDRKLHGPRTKQAWDQLVADELRVCDGFVAFARSEGQRMASLDLQTERREVGRSHPSIPETPAHAINPATPTKRARACVAKAGAAMEAAATARDELVPETGKSPSRQSWEWARDNYYAKNKCPTYDTFCRYVRAYYQAENPTTRIPGQRVESRSAVRAKDQSKR